jgi:hypothetical protein
MDRMPKGAEKREGHALLLCAAANDCERLPADHAAGI